MKGFFFFFFFFLTLFHLLIIFRYSICSYKNSNLDLPKLLSTLLPFKLGFKGHFSNLYLLKPLPIPTHLPLESCLKDHGMRDFESLISSFFLSHIWRYMSLFMYRWIFLV